MILWSIFLLIAEYGAEGRMLAQIQGTEYLHQPKLLSKLDPNYHRMSEWVRKHAPAYFGALKPSSVTNGLDSVVTVPILVDPSDWSINNWLARLFGWLFFHGGPRQIDQSLSLRDLDLAMRQATRETKLSCLCAAHVGVPIHAVLCRDTFMLEPVLEPASSEKKVSQIRDEVLLAGSDTVTEFTHNSAAYVDYISFTGRKVRSMLDEDNTRCVTYCSNLAKRVGENVSK